MNPRRLYWLLLLVIFTMALALATSCTVETSSGGRLEVDGEVVLPLLDTAGEIFREMNRDRDH